MPIRLRRSWLMPVAGCSRGFCGTADGAAHNVVVDFVVDCQAERQEEDDGSLVVAVVAAAGDAAVETQAEQGETESRDMVDVADDDLLAAHFDGDNALP